MIQQLLMIDSGFVVSWESGGEREKRTAPVVGLAIVAGQTGLDGQMAQAIIPMALVDGAFRLVQGKVSLAD